MKKITAILMAASMMVLMLPTIVQASEIDLSKPVEIKEGMGGAVFSITIRGDVQITSYIKWRAVDGNKLSGGDGRSGEISLVPAGFFSNEEFSKTPRHVFGRLAGLVLPPGTYEFYGFHTNGSSSGNRMLSAREDFSRRFSIVPGKIRYIGNLDIYERPPVFSGAGFLSLTFGGVLVGTTEIFPSLLDAGDVDLPLLFAKGNGLTAAGVERNVVVGEADRHMLGLVDALHTRAGQGDLTAAKQLLRGLLDGWSRTADGETFKVPENQALQQQLGTQLAAQGIGDGAYALGLLKLSALQDKTKNSALSTTEGKQVLDDFIADADCYVPGAISQTAWVYDNGIPGVAADSNLSELWEKRRDAVMTISGKSVPYLDAMGRLEYEKFLGSSVPRYFALSVSGAYGVSNGDGASAKAAIAACEAHNVGAAERCRLYTENRQLVWDSCPIEYAGPLANTFPPVTGLGDVADASKLPANLNDSAKSAYREFLVARMPRAFAVADSGEVGLASGDCHAAYKALQKCHELSGKACKLYALDDQIVLGATNPKLVEEEQRLVALVEKASQRNAKLASQTVPAGVSLGVGEIAR